MQCSSVSTTSTQASGRRVAKAARKALAARWCAAPWGSDRIRILGCKGTDYGPTKASSAEAPEPSFGFGRRREALECGPPRRTAAFSPASLLAGPECLPLPAHFRADMGALGGKTREQARGRKAAASCRTPKLRSVWPRRTVFPAACSAPPFQQPLKVSRCGVKSGLRHLLKNDSRSLAAKRSDRGQT